MCRNLHELQYLGNVSDSQCSTQYVYAADGRKLRTKQATAVEGISVMYGQTHELTQAETMDVDTTEYVGS